jgi:hypothetical protein
MGIPLGMLGSYLADQSGADGDAGYYDEYAGEDFTGDDGGDDGGDGGVDDGGMGGVDRGGVPSDMSADELAWYLQTGNLPERYSIRKRKTRRGKGKLTITHGDEHEGGVRGKKPPQRRVCPMDMSPQSIACRRGEEYVPPTMRAPPSFRPPMMPSPIDKPVIGKPVVERPPSTRLPVVAPPKVQPVTDGRRARAAIVSQVMMERGVSLPQASKIVKDEGLY